jgi:hypothetical protein
MLSLLKQTTERIKKGKIDLIELCEILNNSENQEIIGIVPNDWLLFIETKYNKLVDNGAMWDFINKNECSLFTKYNRRFFPINQNTGNDDWRNLGNEILKENYPNEFDKVNKKDKHNNFENEIKQFKKDTNMGSIPVMDPISIKDSEIIDLEIIFNGILQLQNNELTAKCLYKLLCCYNLCHRVFEIDLLIDLLKELLDNKKYRGLIIDGLFHMQYILAHEENLCLVKTLENRFVYTHKMAIRIKDLFEHANFSIEHNPLIVNCLPLGNNIYQMMPFYLSGERSICDTELFNERFQLLTNGLLNGISDLANIAIVGSILVECLGNNNLLKKCIKDHNISETDSSGDSDNDNNDDKPLKLFDMNELNNVDDDILGNENFMYRNKLYYSTDGGDIDIAISEDSYKKYIRIAKKIKDKMNNNIMSLYGSEFKVEEMVTNSGIRYHFSHPKINRKFEIFRVPKTHIDLVSDFHVACVRMYWDFKELYMTRGCLASLLTGVNENFNWFSTNKNPIDIIFKYAQRGYTTILNMKELECASKYIGTFGTLWNYGISKIQDITGSFDYIHPFFRVDVIPKGLRNGHKPIIKNGYIGSLEDNTYKLQQPLKYKKKELNRYIYKDTGYHIRQPLEF